MPIAVTHSPNLLFDLFPVTLLKMPPLPHKETHRWHQALEIACDASIDDIRAAYRKQVRTSFRNYCVVAVFRE